MQILPLGRGDMTFHLAVLNRSGPFTDPKAVGGSALRNRVTKSNQWLPPFNTTGMVCTMLIHIAAEKVKGWSSNGNVFSFV